MYYVKRIHIAPAITNVFFEQKLDFQRNSHPVLRVLVFCQVPGFLTFLAKILVIILGKVCKILQDFS